MQTTINPKLQAPAGKSAGAPDPDSSAEYLRTRELERKISGRNESARAGAEEMRPMSATEDAGRRRLAAASAGAGAPERTSAGVVRGSSSIDFGVGADGCSGVFAEDEGECTEVRGIENSNVVQGLPQSLRITASARTSSTSADELQRVERSTGSDPEGQARFSRAKTKHGTDAGSPRSSAPRATEDKAALWLAAARAESGSTDRTQAVAEGAMMEARQADVGAARPAVPVRRVRAGLLATLALTTAALLLAVAPASADFCPKGSAAGQCEAADAIAVDEETGEVYVADTLNHRVQVFAEDGNFVRAFGWDVIPSGGAGDTGVGLETCTAVSGCKAGVGGAEAGQLGGDGPDRIAVDNDPASPSHHAVYVADRDNLRVLKFSPQGEFTWMIGGGVNKGGGTPSSPGNICTSEHLEHGDVCGKGAGQGTGRFTGRVISVGLGPEGVLYVGDDKEEPFSPTNRVQLFDPDGTQIAEILLPELNVTELAALAADRLSGDFYAVSRATKGVHRYDATGLHTGAIDQFARALAVDAAGNLFVADRTSQPSTPDGGSGLGGIYQYSPAGIPVRTFYGNGTLEFPSLSLAPFSGPGGDMYAVEESVPRRLVHIAFPGPGPVLLPNAAQAGNSEFSVANADTKAESIGSIRATFKTRVNPEGKEAAVHFEYVDDAAYLKDKAEGGDGFAEARRAPEEEAEDPTVAPDAGVWRAKEAGVALACPQPQIELGEGKCLEAETLYHLRAVAVNADGEDTGPEATFETRPAIALGALWATKVGEAGAELNAEVDPIGVPTKARFQYVSEAEFEAEGFAGAAESDEIGFGEAEAGFVAAGTAIGGLQPATTYRYRYVATSFFGDFESPSRSFTTLGEALAPKTGCANQPLRTGAAATLPDCRAYELVSPLDKGGGDVLVAGGGEQGVAVEQSAPSGSALAYTSFRSFGDSISSPITSQYLARRDPADGWESNSLNPPLSGGSLFEGVYLRPIFKGFSEDLCNGWLLQNSDRVLTPGAPDGVPNLYRRSICEGGYELLTSMAPPGFTREGEEGTVESENDTGSKYYPGIGGWSADGSLTAFKAAAALSEEAHIVGQGTTLRCDLGANSADGASPSTYQWLRDGEAIAGQTRIEYETSAADAGKAIQCRLVAVNAEADTVTGARVGALALSNPAPVVSPASEGLPPIAPPYIPPPESSAPLEVGGEGGQELSCDAREGRWQGEPSGFSYEWLRNGAPPAIGTGATTSKSTTVKAVTTATGEGTLQAGSTTIADLSTASGTFAAGQTIAAAGIPTATTIAAVGKGTLELSQAATQSGARSLAAGAQPFAVGWKITESSANVIAPGTTILAVDGQTLTLSAPAKFSLGKVSFAAAPTTPGYTTSAADLAAAATFQCIVTATNAGGTVSIASANLTTTGPAPDPLAPHPRAFTLDVYRVYAKQGEDLALVSVAPSGEAMHTHAAVGTRTLEAAADTNSTDSVIGAVSGDGRRIFFSATTRVPPQPVHQSQAVFVPRGDEGASRLYLRLNPMAPQSEVEEPSEGQFRCTESSKACTVAISTGVARFIAADPDAETALYMEADKLYELDVEAAIAYEPEAATELASGVRGVLGASRDASRAYLVSDAVCSAVPNSEGQIPQAGKPNLYLYERGQGCGAQKLAFVGTLGDRDVAGGDNLSVIAPEPFARHSRVSPSGLHAAFVSRAPLTGYDNIDARGGEPAAEVFVYDAAEAQLFCASCNPGGGRPRGENVGTALAPVWVSAQIPGWATQWHPSRALAEDGERLFFESYEALVPRDGNGRLDVYQWQRAASRRDCEEAGAERYAPDSEGCLSLISSGTSGGDSTFLDASASGVDVFFRTPSSLVAEDYGLIDIYDARIGGGFAQGEDEAGSECEGEACQSPPSSPAQITPSSAAFRGPGDVARNPCAASARKARRLAGDAKRLRRVSRRARGRRAALARRKAARSARQARRLSAKARLCRRRAREGGR